MTDSVSGLVWLKNPDCLGSLPWIGANDAAADLMDGDCDLDDRSSIGDWRLPSAVEWEWSSALFGVANDASIHWSAVTDDTHQNQALAAQLGLGLASHPKTDTYQVWPVRVGQGLPSAAGAGQPLARYLPMGTNGEIIKDVVTGLEWQRCSVDQSWNASTQACDGNANIYGWADAVSRWPATAPWRLPTIEELRTLVYCSTGTPILFDMSYDRTLCSGSSYQRPTILLSAFPNTPSSRFWSSSTYPTPDTVAWDVSFDNGYVFGNYKYFGQYVRLVHDGQ